jgi:hypothetical protein
MVSLMEKGSMNGKKEDIIKVNSIKEWEKELENGLMLMELFTKVHFCIW